MEASLILVTKLLLGPPECWDHSEERGLFYVCLYLGLGKCKWMVVCMCVQEGVLGLGVVMPAFYMAHGIHTGTS